MTPPWGINWQRYHADRDDMPHIAKMGYASFTTYGGMWDNRDFVNELLSVARKDAIFLNRDHPLSETKDDQWKSDPAFKGRDHADQWMQKVKAGTVYTPLDRTYFLGLNEMDSEHYQRQIDAYTEAYCRRMAEHGLRAAAYSFGVGHPSTVDLQPKNPPDWSWYAASAAAILEGHHLVATHEYGAPDGYGWEYWCNRISFCPYPFDVVFDECGIDYGVVDSGNLKGWSAFMDGPAYCRWLDGFQAGMAERANTRKVKILAYNIFGFDHGSSDKKDWHSFDIRPIRPPLEAFVWTVVATPPSLPPLAQPPAPVETRLPVIEAPAPQEPTPAPVPTGIIAPKVAQAILKIESGGRTHGEDGKLLIRFEAHIFKTQLGDDALWAEHFRTDAQRAWVDQMWRRSAAEPWRMIHTGKQADEYAAFDFAVGLDPDAAFNAISMGAGQIMGFNHARIGYSSAEVMFNAFASATLQTIGFINFFLSDPTLAEAMRRKDWREVARRYNGAGAVDSYSKLLEDAYNALGG